jgi:chitin synthase
VVQDFRAQVEVEVLDDMEDINDMYNESLENLKTRKPVYKPKPKTTDADREQVAKDYYASVRTNVSVQ